jgi:predicted RNA-binding protein YlxR (DUF448 family)
MISVVLRTCIGCRTVRPKSELVRLVVKGDGRVAPDPSRAAPGRGAYLCPGRGCLQAAVKRGRLARAFRGPVEIAPELLAERA